MNIFIRFLNGKIKLWKSFWLIGFLHGFFVMYGLPIIEIFFFQNKNFFTIVVLNNLEFKIIDYTKITFISKLIMIISLAIVTIGIWRSAENYKGKTFIIFLTLFYLTFNNLFPLWSLFKRLII
jgi:hypothetical protein